MYANDFGEILDSLQRNDNLLERVVKLIKTEPTSGKVTEGGERLGTFRTIMTKLVSGQSSLQEAIRETEAELPRWNSPHRENNRVFASGWSERLVRTQLSRFYNQAVMEELISKGETHCFVPHSSYEDSGSPCSLFIAGKTQDIELLHSRLIESYRDGMWSKTPKIPHHPHCTHVVRPLPSQTSIK